MQEIWVQSLGWEDPMEKGIATHSSVLVWRILWIEKPGRLQSHGVAKSQTWLSNKHYHFHQNLGFWMSKKLHVFTEETMDLILHIWFYCCSVTQLRLTLCNLVECSRPDFPVLHHLLKLAQIHVHWISNIIQLSHPLSPPSPPAFSLSHHQGFFFPMSWLFTSDSQSIGASASVSVLPISIQGWFPLRLTGLIFLQLRDSQESFPAPQFESTDSSALSLPYGPTLTSVHDYWKNHSFPMGNRS